MKPKRCKYTSTPSTHLSSVKLKHMTILNEAMVYIPSVKKAHSFTITQGNPPLSKLFS